MKHRFDQLDVFGAAPVPATHSRGATPPVWTCAHGGFAR
jgi:hypothetical protein